MTRVESALAVPLKAFEVPTEIVFVPEGDHSITPESHPDGIRVHMPSAKGVSVAAAFQKQLDGLLANNIRPAFDFDHNSKGPNSGFPTKFRYEPGKGLICAVDWSGAGKRALEGGDYGYFSPVVDIDDDGVPAGLPDRGPLGGLVNEPAFRDMPRIAAAEAERSKKSPTAMPKELVTCGLLNEAEASRENAIELATNRVKAMRDDGTALSDKDKRIKELEDENTELKGKVQAADDAKKVEGEKRADDLVKAAVADGRILPKDEETSKYFRERITAGDAGAEKILAGMPKINPDIEKTVIEGGADKPGHDKFKDLSGRELVAAALSDQAKK